jgi:hypothetical protein
MPGLALFRFDLAASIGRWKLANGWASPMKMSSRPQTPRSLQGALPRFAREPGTPRPPGALLIWVPSACPGPRIRLVQRRAVLVQLARTSSPPQTYTPVPLSTRSPSSDSRSSETAAGCPSTRRARALVEQIVVSWRLRAGFPAVRAAPPEPCQRRNQEREEGGVDESDREP